MINWRPARFSQGISLIAAAILATGALLALADGAGDSRLRAPWPTMIVRADNPSTPAKVELGRILFFDPVLSNSNTISCAHCHHPDLGFSDGLARARGYGGEGAGNRRCDGILLPRRTSTL